MRKSLIGRFVVWWLTKNGWPQIISYHCPQGAEILPRQMQVTYRGKTATYILLWTRRP